LHKGSALHAVPLLGKVDIRCWFTTWRMDANKFSVWNMSNRLLNKCDAITPNSVFTSSCTPAFCYCGLTHHFSLKMNPWHPSKVGNRILSTSSPLTPTLRQSWVKTRKSTNTPTTWFVDGADDVSAAARRIAVHKCVQLELMLGQLANFCPVISMTYLTQSHPYTTGLAGRSKPLLLRAPQCSDNEMDDSCNFLQTVVPYRQWHSRLRQRTSAPVENRTDCANT